MKLTIITAVLNGEGNIHLCLDSISKQNCIAEHIVVDGGSTDRTLNIIDENKISSAQIVSEPDKGIYDAMNKGIQLASGEIVGVLNADDFYAGSDVLAKIVEVFSNSDVDSCYGDLVYVDKKNTDRVVRYWHSGEYNSENFYWGWMPPHPTFFVRRSVYEKYGLFNLSLGSAADYELMLRFLLKHKITCKYIPEILVHMRVGGQSNASLKNRLIANHNDHKAWKLNNLKPYPWTLSLKPLRKIRQYFKRPQ